MFWSFRFSFGHFILISVDSVVLFWFQFCFCFGCLALVCSFDFVSVVSFLFRLFRYCFGHFISYQDWTLSGLGAYQDWAHIRIGRVSGVGAYQDWTCIRNGRVSGLDIDGYWRNLKIGRVF